MMHEQQPASQAEGLRESERYQGAEEQHGDHSTAKRREEKEQITDKLQDIEDAINHGT